MCRHLCYLGEPVAISEIVTRPPHSLLVQSYSPSDMRGGGRVNADGFGVGWYDGPVAARYRKAGPIWLDSGFAEVAERVTAGAILAAVRNATAGMPVTETAAAPFTDGRWLFSLNGRIDGYPDAAVDLAATLAVRELITLDASTDAALLWAVLRRRLTSANHGVPVDPAEVLEGLVAEVLRSAPDSRLNLLLTDGESCWATTVTHSLWIRSDQSGTLVASEPLDQHPGWESIPDRRLVTANRSGVEVRPLAG